MRDAVSVKVEALLLANYAEVRDGLAFIASGGWDRCKIAVFPGRIGVSVVAIVSNDSGAHADELMLRLVDEPTAAVLIDDERMAVYHQRNRCCISTSGVVTVTEPTTLAAQIIHGGMVVATTTVPVVQIVHEDPYPHY